MADVNFDDTRMVLDDLTAVFADIADHEKVASINETFEDVLEMCGTKEKQIQEIITGR